MKIVFTAHGKTWESKMDTRFGRAEGFLLFDDKSNELTWYENSQNINAAHGAGIQAAGHVVKNGAEVLITGHVGPKAFDVLSSSKIKIFTGAENLTVKEAYEKFKKGELTEADEANSVGMG